MHSMKIKIDNTEVEFYKDETILDCARRAGVDVPTLCHRDGVEHYSSCMVCMVRVKETNAFVPSCSALAQEGMDIDASGDEVVRMRHEALNLLLSEHRAECEAPCRIVCPAGYNIPLMNRLLSASKFEEAAELISSETGGNELKCIRCKAFCENACRRKKIDEPVSIRNIRIFLSMNKTNTTDVKTSVPASAAAVRTRFSSRTGRLDESEQREWLKECPENVIRHREITDLTTATEEAESCMHCDCRAAGDCRLRELAEKFGLKDPGGKIANAPVAKKINRKAGLIFEHAKCIKCGLCVRICNDSTTEPAPCFINRGFVTVISEPLTGDFDDILPPVAEKCIAICPTGALARFEDNSIK
jgi:predicted molibdopterin-dependent oxidoreductase YjgC